VIANVSWANLGNMKDKYPQATFGAEHKAFFVDSSLSFPPHIVSGLAFTVVKPSCSGPGCDMWRVSDSNWLLITIRYKYDDIYIQPKVMSVVQLPDTSLLDEHASVTIVSPTTLFIFDVDSLVRFDVTNGMAKVTSVKTLPKVRKTDSEFRLTMVPFVSGALIIYYSDVNTVVQYDYTNEILNETAVGYLPLGMTEFYPDRSGFLSFYIVANTTFDFKNNFTHAQMAWVSPPETSPFQQVGYTDNCYGRDRPKSLQCVAMSTLGLFWEPNFYTCDYYGPNPTFAQWNWNNPNAPTSSFKVQVPSSPPPPRSWSVVAYGIG